MLTAMLSGDCALYDTRPWMYACVLLRVCLYVTNEDVQPAVSTEFLSVDDHYCNSGNRSNLSTLPSYFRHGGSSPLRPYILHR